MAHWVAKNTPAMIISAIDSAGWTTQCYETKSSENGSLILIAAFSSSLDANQVAARLGSSARYLGLCDENFHKQRYDFLQEFKRSSDEQTVRERDFLDHAK